MTTDICIVLVEPKGALNIGSVCRSMMNFGVSDLRLVNPCNNYSGFKAKQMALKATSILDQATVFNQLSSAIEDRSIIFGTTRRVGKNRLRSRFMSPEQAAQLIPNITSSAKVAYVFGREDVGLYNTELDLCNHFVTIPTDKLYESMNLSHAVNICIYEFKKNISRNLSNKTNNKDKLISLVSSKDLEFMFKHMKSTLLSIGYLDPNNPNHIVRTFRNILNRTKLNNREVSILHGLWSRIDWIEKERIKHLLKNNNSDQKSY